MFKAAVKAILHAGALLAASPFILWAYFGQRVLRSEGPYSTAAYALALFPGLPGLLLRRAFYRCVLAEAHWSLSIGFGSAITHPTARLDERVWIGAYSLVGRARVERDVIIGSRVSVLSGRRPHRFDRVDQTIADQPGEYAEVRIGADSWLGEACVVMADIGQGCVIGAGAVVVKPVPDLAIMGGNPARQIGTRGAEVPGTVLVD